MSNRFLFLGTGASTGTPLIGCDCTVCVSGNARNRRLRTAGLLTWQGKQLLIDVGPDYRQQALGIGLGRPDGILITHAHYDHIAGMDELRVLFLQDKAAIPCLLSQATFDHLQQRYSYLFGPSAPQNRLLPKLDFQVFPADRGEIDFLELSVGYFTFEQGGFAVNGFRFDGFAYLSDIDTYPDTLIDDLQGVRTLVLSALRFAPSHVHFTLDEAIDFARQVGAEQTWLVHMGHELDHNDADSYLPSGIALSYDGLEIEV